VKLARKIGGNLPLAQFELEIMPGAAVEDAQLADVIASNLASHGHPTATVPMGGPPGLVGAQRLAWRPEGDRRTSCR
jgi:choline dehydrogenase